MTFSAIPPEVLALVAALAMLAVLVQVVSTKLAAWGRSRRARARAARAGEGERDAAGWLEEAGFEVEAAQATGSYHVEVDGEAVAVPLRADYVVRRDGRRWVAEVKTGGVAPRIGTAATRRQLLEYLVAFEVDGVLLVDAERGTVHDVRFPSREAAPIATPARGLVWVFAALAAGALAGALATTYVQAQAAARASSAAGAFGAVIPERTHLRAASSATGLRQATQP